MLNIIKYDFMKKYKAILILIISDLLLNLLSIVKYAVQGSVLFLGMFPMVIIFLYITDIIKMYSDDLNKKSGYMLFMTSNSGYKIIMSKVITAILEALSILLFYFILILINSIYISNTQGFDFNISGVIEAINSALSGNFGFNLGHIFVVLITVLVFCISFILTVYTSITIRKSIFSETKFGGFLSFVIFIFLNWATTFTTGKLLNILSPYYDNLITIGSRISSTQLLAVFMPVIILSIVQCIIMTLCSGYLLEKKINL